jgi:2-polyprenyl-3-methyl-5-hydroxy-6-metoxy-1,4-benzoquinol methylase
LQTERLAYRDKFYNEYLATSGVSSLDQIRVQLTHRRPHIRQIIRSWIPKDRRAAILDLGCGYGAFLYFLKEAGYSNLKGIDESEQQVTMARALGLACVERQEILSHVQTQDSGTWDVVIVFDVMEHLTKPELIELTKDLHRVLKQGGRLIVHVPNGDAIFSGRVFFGDLTHETCFTPRSMQQLLSLCGFSIFSFVEDVPVIHGTKSLLRYVLWKTFRGLYRLVYVAETGDIGKNLILTQNFLAVACK